MINTREGLHLDDVTVAIGDRAVLTATTLQLPPGAGLAVVGEAGSGKSTVLSVLAGRRAPTRGTVLLEGRPVRRADVGLLDQQHELPAGLTAAEQVAVAVLARGDRAADRWVDVEDLLAAVGLPASGRHNLLEELSGGQQQRVAIARALIGGPPLLCLDDPTSELDAASADVVWSVLERARSRGAILVVATPRPEEAARLDAVLMLG